MKKIVKKILRRLLSVSRITRGSHNLSDLCFLLKKTKGCYTVLQIGANDGERHDPLKDIIARDKPACWLVEPIPDYYAALNLKYVQHKNIQCINTCISEKSGSIEMYIVDPSMTTHDWEHGIASLDSGHFKRCGVAEENIIVKNVKSVTFDQFFAQHQIKNVDVLVTDCEGYDLHLLKMFPFHSFNTRIVQIEMDSRQTFSATECAEVIKILVENGFHEFHKKNQDLLAWKNPL